jgi:RimJ/RimL family protein N-acetyltransferase
MEITIRPTIEMDLAAIQSIRTDPLVIPHQYRLTSADTVEFWRGKLFGAEQTGNAVLRSHTLLLENEMVGHVIHTQFKNERVGQFGWNLMPIHWGKGFAYQGLTLVFDELAAEQDGQLFVADCFSANQRCRKLLNRLGFVPTSIPLFERLMIAVYMRCGHWIRRHYLKADEWKQRRSEQRKEKPSLAAASDGS